MLNYLTPKLTFMFCVLYTTIIQQLQLSTVSQYKEQIIPSLQVNLLHVTHIFSGQVTLSHKVRNPNSVIPRDFEPKKGT